LPGPTLPFNILRSDGSLVGYNEVSKLAALFKTPIQLRTGCFCNPGACQVALNQKEDEVKSNYLTSGKVCGDHIDVINGSATGAIRISVGKDSIWEDIDVAITFLERTFVDKGSVLVSPYGGAATIQGTHTNEKVHKEFRLTEMYVFPIKSCSGMCLN